MQYIGHTINVTSNSIPVYTKTHKWYCNILEGYISSLMVSKVIVQFIKYSVCI